MDFCQEKERSHVRKKELYDELTRLRRLWPICALECPKSTGRVTTSGGQRLKSNGADFAFRGGRGIS